MKIQKIAMVLMLGLAQLTNAASIKTHCVCVYSKSSDAQPENAALSTVLIQDLEGIIPDGSDADDVKSFMQAFSHQCQQSSATLAVFQDGKKVVSMMGCNAVFDRLD